MYQCGRCGLTRASSQEPIGSVLPQCKCPWEFTPPVMQLQQQRTWVGLTQEDIEEAYKRAEKKEPYMGAVTRKGIAEAFEQILKEKNT